MIHSYPATLRSRRHLILLWMVILLHGQDVVCVRREETVVEANNNNNNNNPFSNQAYASVIIHDQAALRSRQVQLKRLSSKWNSVIQRTLKSGSMHISFHSFSKKGKGHHHHHSSSKRSKKSTSSSLKDSQHHTISYKDLTSSKHRYGMGHRSSRTMQSNHSSRIRYSRKKERSTSNHKDSNRISRPTSSSNTSDKDESSINESPKASSHFIRSRTGSRPKKHLRSSSKPITKSSKSMKSSSSSKGPVFEPQPSPSTSSTTTESPTDLFELIGDEECIQNADQLEDAIQNLPYPTTSSSSPVQQQQQRLLQQQTVIPLCPTSIIMLTKAMNITKKAFVLTCPAAASCLIQGQGNHRLFRIGTESYISFHNIHFTNGQAGFGGSISIRGNNNNVTITRCIFSNNTAIDAGGALYIDSSSTTLVSIENSNFTNNKADLGGAIYSIITQNIKITDTNFQANQADTSGGAIFVDRESSIQISNSVFYSNSVNGVGGAITLEPTSRVDLLGSTVFLDNTILPSILNNAIQLSEPSSTKKSPYLYCDNVTDNSMILFCDGIDSISGANTENTNCLSEASIPDASSTSGACQVGR